MATSLDQRNALFTASLGEYADKGFTLNETEDGLELRRHNQLCDRFTWQATFTAIRNACQAWMIKEGDFGGGIEYGGAK